MPGGRRTGPASSRYCMSEVSAPATPPQDTRCPRTQRGVGVEQGSVLTSLELLKQAVSLKATTVHKLCY